MDFFDIVKELREGDPDVNKAAKAMKLMGWICVAGAIWNFTIYYIAPFDERPFNLPPNFPYLALISFLFLGGLFLYSSQAIKEMNPIGIKTGQISIILLVVIFVGFIFLIFPTESFPANEGPFRIIFIIFCAIFFAQFGIPAYYGVRYLGRLPAQNDYFEKIKLKPHSTITVMGNEKSHDDSISPTNYKEALLPFGVFGTFALLIAIPLVSFFAIEKFGDTNQIAFPLMPTFLFIFLAPVAYNFLPSSFEKQRNPIASFTGGGSIFLFNGTWPFFRLIIYDDGLEIRVMFHRFFIPYDKMEDIPKKIGFFTRGILIKSNLPDVPTGIRYQGFGMKRIVEVITQLKGSGESDISI